MTPEQVEGIIKRTVEQASEKFREDVRGMFTSLGFNMDPDKAHEEQQMIAFVRGMYQGKKVGTRALITGILTAAIGWAVWFFTGKPHP